MVTTSPIKPSSLKMLRHKKQQQQPVEDDIATNDVEITPTYDEETGSENMQTTILTPSVASVNNASCSTTTTGGGGGGRKSRLGLFRKSSSAASSNSNSGGGISYPNNNNNIYIAGSV